MPQTASVLFVDDQPDVAEMLAAWFRNRGQLSVAATSGRDAWAILESIGIDVLVTDLVMPMETRQALLARVRADPRFAVLPVIAISGVLGALEGPALLASGFDGFHTKPVALAGLYDEIAALARRSAVVRR